MKLEIKLIPSDMNEAQAILKALGGFNVAGGTVAAEVDTTPSQVESLGKPTVETATEVGGSTKSTTAPVTAQDTMPELKDLTLGTERDSANRLWCAEINTSNKGTKKDLTFKRSPGVDDAYFEHVINLLEQEAITFTPEPTVAPVPEIAPAPQPEPAPAPQPEPAPAPQPEPAPAPQPEPAPVPQRTIVAYMYNGQRYNPEQLAGWSAEQIAANCEPVYDDAPVETPAATVCLETQVKPLVSELAGNDGMAIHCQKLCGLLSGQEKGIPQDVPEEKRGQLLKALETMKANKVAVKDGSMPVEQLI